MDGWVQYQISKRKVSWIGESAPNTNSINQTILQPKTAIYKSHVAAKNVLRSKLRDSPEILNLSLFPQIPPAFSFPIPSRSAHTLSPFGPSHTQKNHGEGPLHDKVTLEETLVKITEIFESMENPPISFTTVNTYSKCSGECIDMSVFVLASFLSDG